MLEAAACTACIEMLFLTETDSLEERIERTKAAGLDAIEFWHWAHKDIDAIARASLRTGVAVHAIAVDFRIGLLDLANLDANLASLRSSILMAQRLGAPVLIAQAGYTEPGRSRADQRAALVGSLQAAGEVLAGSGVRLALEPLNTLVDHAGYFLDSTAEGLDIVDAAGSPDIGLLLDIYHAMIMSEDVATVVGDRIDRIVHVHLADAPGRNEMGNGSSALEQSVRWLRDNGYSGKFGLEFWPTMGSAAAIAHLLGRLSVSY